MRTSGCASASSGASTSARHSGHVELSRNHAPMHSTWNRCPHRGSAGLLAVLELGEADRAVSGAHGRGDHGERVEHRRVEPPRRRRLANAGDGRAAVELATVARAPAPAAVVQVQRDEGWEDARERPGGGEQELAGHGVAGRSLHLNSTTGPVVGTSGP
ncbi:hypothetical protein ZWY2020_032148 [Hordeum vulgare]|nr:hypothetical protein ZWY2020_032148 [Hordeum vulgare]